MNLGHIEEQIEQVLNKYSISYTLKGVRANFDAWTENKKPLYNLLRKHSQWNEDELAIVFESTFTRKTRLSDVILYTTKLRNLAHTLSDDLVNNAIKHITELPPPMSDKVLNKLLESIGSYTAELINIHYPDFAHKFTTDANESTLMECCITCINLLCFTSILNKEFPSTFLTKKDTPIIYYIYKNTGVLLKVGQKRSRAINAVSAVFKLNEHPDYNKIFAQLADSFNPIEITNKTILSIHPCDYLEMSNKDNSWDSCHRINGGEYQAGTLSYMNDTCSMIFYTTDNDVTEDYHKYPKRTRQVFAYMDGVLLQSRLYPNTYDDETRDKYRAAVQSIIAQCLELPNLWNKKYYDDVGDYIRSHYDALHYPDYDCSDYRANVSMLKEGYISTDAMVIGHTSYCLECGDIIIRENELQCDDCCRDTYQCYHCGTDIPDDNVVYVDDNSYCHDCVNYCNYHDDYTLSEIHSIELVRRYNNFAPRYVQVCDECLCEQLVQCDDCEVYIDIDDAEATQDGAHICPNCMSSYKKCSICEEICKQDEVITETTDEVEYHYCNNCYNERREVC